MSLQGPRQRDPGMKAAGEGPNCETSMGPQGPKSDCDSLSVVRPEKSHQGSRLLSVPCILPQVPVVRGRAGPQTDLKLLTIPEACSPSPCLSPNFLISGTSGRQRSSGSLQGSPHGTTPPPRLRHLPGGGSPHLYVRASEGSSQNGKTLSPSCGRRIHWCLSEAPG